MKISSFSKTYDNRTVLSFPDFTLRKGTIYAIIGANGSGKSTFAKILSGTVQPDLPSASILEPSVSIGYLPQNPYAFHMSLEKNLLLNASGDKNALKVRAQHLMEVLHLTHLSQAKASSLSGGETARMSLARLMMKEYSLLILDEPCASMDIHSTIQAEELIQEYCRETDSAILLITHSLQQASRIADEILFFHEGTLLETGETDQVLHHPKHPETRRFLDFFYYL